MTKPRVSQLAQSGAAGGQVITWVATTGQWEPVTVTAASVSAAGLRNRVHNGDCRVNQRAYASGALLAAGAYGFDRWAATVAGTALAFTAAPSGQAVTISSGGAIAQVIERADMPAGTYLLSWAGTATGRIYNSGATPPAPAASPVLVTLDGLADVVVEFTAVGGAQTLGAVQVEAGTTTSGVTPFERRPLGMELALCQRYFWRQNFANAGNRVNIGQAFEAGAAYVQTTFHVTMRAAPTMTSSGAGNFRLTDATAATTLTVTGLTLAVVNVDGATLDARVASGLVAGDATQLYAGVAGQYIDWAADL